MVLAVAISVALSLVSCGSSDPLSNLNSTKVKALWFSGEGDSTKQGIAEVTVSTGLGDPSHGFQLDLDTERAQGAGASWTAATWSAASVATLFSFRDPLTVRISVAIDGAIDGPSAGGLMAASMLALNSGMTLDQDATMTGTINPDGSIGLVAGIPAKIQAAHEAGLKKVLIPAGGKMSTDPRTGKVVNTIAEGKRLGITVVEVASVLEALASLTGEEQDFSDGYGKSAPISEPVLAAISDSARTLETLLREQLTKATRVGVSERTVAQAAQDARTGASLLRRSRIVEAYAQLWQTYEQLATKLSARETVLVAQRGGAEEAKRDLLSQIHDLERVNFRKQEAAADLGAANIQQLVGLPDALTWSTDPQILLNVYRERLASSNTKASLKLLAGAVGEARAEIEVALAQATSVLMASGSGTASPEDVSRALAGYTDFLKQTGDANVNYFEQVLARVEDDSERLDQLREYFAYDVANSLRTQLGEGTSSKSGSIQDQRRQLALAVSYYIGSAQLVVETEILRVEPLDPLNRRLIIGNEAGFNNAAKSSDYVNGSLLEILTEEKVDSSYAHWGAKWGKLLMADSTISSADSRQLTGLTSSWRSSIQLLILNAQPIQQAMKSGGKVS